MSDCATSRLYGICKGIVLRTIPDDNFHELQKYTYSNAIKSTKDKVITVGKQVMVFL